MSKSTASAQPSKNSASDFPAKLGTPALRALNGAGFTRLEHLTMTTEMDLLGLHGIGPKAVEQLREAMTEKGLFFYSLPIKRTRG